MTPPIASQETLEILNALQRAVDKALERKRRLGHYAVIWRDNAIVLDGEDAPTVAMPSQTQS